MLVHLGKRAFKLHIKTVFQEYVDKWGNEHLAGLTVRNKKFHITRENGGVWALKVFR